MTNVNPTYVTDRQTDGPRSMLNTSLYGPGT